MRKHPVKRPEMKTSDERRSVDERAANGISVIICTNRQQYLSDIFSNYGRQLYKPTELILILNDNKMDAGLYQAVANQYPDVSVYQMDESASLGKCLNFAVSKAKYPIVAKFDDDDYYSPYYLSGVAQCFRNSKADVLGKRTCYLYIESKSLLVLFHPDQDNRSAEMVMGSTLACRRNVLQKIKFRNVTRGEDTYFFEDCAKKGIKIYSCDPFNYVCIRRSNRFSHTWTIDEKTILQHSREVVRTSNFTLYANRVVPARQSWQT